MGDFNIRQMMNRVLEESVFKKPLKKELIAIFNDIAPLYVPSGNEESLVGYAWDVLRESGFEVKVDKAANIEATRGHVDGQKLVAINAHTDTVQRKEDEGIEAVHEGALYNWIRDEFLADGYMIGGDDKCGVAVALCLAQHTDLPMKVVLTTGEESGGTGMKALRKGVWDNVAFCFTVDRMHGTDLISEYCGSPCAPKTFVDKFIEISLRDVGIKYVDTFGSWADTAEISNHVPAVNLSAGYYNPHTNRDFIKCDEMYKTMMAVKSAIEHKPELEAAIAAAPPDWKTARRAFYGGMDGGFYSYGWDEDYYLPPTTKSTTDTYDILGKEARKGKGWKPPKKDYKKCRLKFKQRDDKEDKLQTVEMTPDEKEIINNYMEGILTDDEWDDMLANGILTKSLYNLGIDLKVQGRMNEPEESLSGDEYDEELESAILRSGYLPGSNEHQVFVDYLLGAIDYNDLANYALKKEIDWDLVKRATEEKEKLEGTPVGTELSKWKKEALEEREYSDNKGKKRKPVKTQQEVLIDDFVNGVVLDEEWTEFLEKGIISKDTYNAGHIERDLEDAKEDLRIKHGMNDPVVAMTPANAIALYAAGRMDYERFKRLKTTGEITNDEFNEGIKKRMKATEPTRDEEYVRWFVEGTIPKDTWDRMYGQGQIPKAMYEDGIVKRTIYAGLQHGKQYESLSKKAKKKLKKREEKPLKWFSTAKEKDYVKQYVDGVLGFDTWLRMYNTGTISKSAYHEGLAKATRPPIRMIPPLQKSYDELVRAASAGEMMLSEFDKSVKTPHQHTLDNPSTFAKTTLQDGLELVRQFAVGAIDVGEWERMISKREMPLWVYDRGYLERKHYVNHGYFSDYMNKNSRPPKNKEFRPSESVLMLKDPSPELIDKFVKWKISYNGWITMRASGEITDDAFVEGLRRRGDPPLAIAREDLEKVISRYNADFDAEEPEDQTDVR